MALGFDYSVQISDPDNLAAGQQKALLKNVDAAIANWARYISGAGSVDVQLIIDPTPGFRAASASATNITIGQFNGKTLVREGVQHELLTGIDLNGDAPDAIITVGAEYLSNFLWLDPRPFSRNLPVPVDKNDGVSLFMHEFGHVLGMNGSVKRMVNSPGPPPVSMIVTSPSRAGFHSLRVQPSKNFTAGLCLSPAPTRTRIHTTTTVTSPPTSSILP